MDNSTQSIELLVNSEMALLGALLDVNTTSDNMNLILSKLPANAFTHGARRSLFDAIKQAYDEYGEFDIATIINNMGGEPGANKMLIMQCIDYHVTPAVIPANIERVFGEYRVRVLKHSLTAVTDGIDSHSSPADIIAAFNKATAVQSKLDEILISCSSMSITDSLLELMEYLYDEDTVSYKTGLSRFDYALGGFYPKEFTVISGRSGGGKSDLSVFIATNLATNGVRVLYLSLEMSRLQIVERIISRAVKVNSIKLRDKQLTNDEKYTMGTVFNKISTIPLVLDEQQNLNMSDIRSKIKQHKPQVVFIDHIGLMAQDNHKKQWENTAQISKELKQLAMSANVSIVGIVQQTRDVESRTGGKSHLSDLKGSDNLGNDADKVMFIGIDPKDASLPDATFVKASLQIVKNRSGSSGEIKFNWYRETHNYVERVSI